MMGSFFRAVNGMFRKIVVLFAAILAILLYNITVSYGQLESFEEGNLYFMHIYIIAQHLNLSGQGEDRLYRLGREYAAREHDVTILTGNGGTGLDLGKKKIGLKQVEGQTLVAFNVAYDPEMSRRQKISAYLGFARLAGRQGLKLPRPDLIIVLSPPLTAALPALKLSKHYAVPLVVEVREIWPDAPVQRGSLRNSLLIKEARKLEKRLYEKADRIVVNSKGIADIVKERSTGQAGVTLIPDRVDDNEVVGIYDQVLKGLVDRNKLQE